MIGAFRFIGQDGSMGLKRGTVYIVKVMTISAEGTLRAEILRIGFRCPYSSWATFRQNWSPMQ